ncbi:Uncharacterised protein [Bordetella pertussis]|nr:Uncharacterised protein [Bordetella pertussis]
MASSLRTSSAWPSKPSLIGPRRTVTEPWYLSGPSTSVRRAPGRQGMMRGTSSINCHASSSGKDTWKVLVNSIDKLP